MFDMLRNLKVYTLIRTEYSRKAQNVPNEYHWHDYYQFIYVRKGSGAVVIDGEPIYVSENDAIVIKKNEPHTFWTTSDKMETYEVKFIIIDEQSDFLKSSPRYFCRDSAGSIKHALRQIERESDAVDEFSRDVVSVEMCKILLLMKREISRRREIEDIETTTVDEEINDELLDKIRRYIDENITENITVKDVSEFVCVEYKYFSHHFALRYGMRLKRYIRRKRLELAKDLIVNSELSMTEIAGKCGFGTIHYMTRVFKSEENISPTEFRRRFKNKYAIMLDAAPVSYYDDGKCAQ
ncbi:MAG: helix-turn-helix domain-containing protein [Ruminococcaceae bacterium]|nr:helix-turn-helix domain-containing protein [Oscillospiraceae bacterium]